MTTEPLQQKMEDVDGTLVVLSLDEQDALNAERAAKDREALEYALRSLVKLHRTDFEVLVRSERDKRGLVPYTDPGYISLLEQARN